MRIKPIFAWYDIWIGMFWDTRKRKLYILPVPCLGIVMDLSARPDAGKTEDDYGRNVTNVDRYPG
jgi:hypothetical protein